MRLRPGRRLQFFKKGDAPKFLSVEFANLFVALFNAVMNLRIKDGKFLISDDAMAIETEGDSGGSVATGELQTVRFKSRSGDVLICRTWDGATEGDTDIAVASNFQSRQLGSETINGVTYTYTSYSDIGDAINYTRDSDDGSTNETQIVTPMWYENCLISVAACSFSGVTSGDVPVALIEVSARCWAKVEEEE